MEQYNRFEKARIIGARALQIAMGAPVLLDDVSTLIDPVRVAENEFRRGIIPITVVKPKKAGTRKASTVTLAA